MSEEEYYEACREYEEWLAEQYQKEQANEREHVNL